MVNTTKTQTRRPARPHRRPVVRRSKTRLIDLDGIKLYSMIAYRLSMTIIISLTLLKIGTTGS